MALAAAGLAPAVAGHPLGLEQNLSLAAASGLLALATVKLVEDQVLFSSWLRARRVAAWPWGRD